MMTVPPRKPRRTWLIPAILAFVIFIGDVAIEIVAPQLDQVLKPYYWVVWVIFGTALIAAVAAAIREAWQPSEPSDSTGSTNISAQRDVSVHGEVRDSTIITGDRNVVQQGKCNVNIGQAQSVTIGDTIVQPLPEVQRLHQLPADLADFTGREQEVNDLLRLLGQGKGHATISAIGGMGGVGKSALAVHVAHRLVEHHPDAQLVVDLRGTSERPLTSTEAMANITHAFHPEARLPDDPDQVAQVYRSVLKDKRALILLDNAASAAQVRPLLPPPPCALIVTSRRAIALPGLRTFNLDALPEKEACHLLQTILGKDRATEEELNAIAVLCGRLPLALRVAGTFLAVHPDWTAGEYIQALADERKRLARLKQDDLDVEATLGLSAAQLARELPDLAACWQMLAVFPATFDRAAAAAVWEVIEEEAHDGLSALVERSLLLYDTESARYRLHDLMRPVARNAFAYGGGKPDTTVERQRLEQTAARHATYYKTVAAVAHDLYLKGGDAIKRGLDLFDLEWENIQAGQAWAAAHAVEDDEAAKLCSDYPVVGAYLLNLRQHPRQNIRWLEAALAAARRLKQRGDENAHLGNLGLAYADLGETRRAIEFYEQHLTIVREIGNRRGESNDLGNLGSAYQLLGETYRAIEFFEQHLTMAREIGDRHGEGITLGNLGNAYADLGETRRAIEFHEQALVIAREIGDRHGEGNTLGNLGNAYVDLGETRRAIEFHEQALVIAREIGNRRGEGNTLGNLGNAYVDLGETRRAIEFYEQHLTIAREIGNRRGEGNALWNMSLSLDKLGDRPQAIAYAETALKIYEQIEDPNAAKVRRQLAEWCEQK